MPATMAPSIEMGELHSEAKSIASAQLPGIMAHPEFKGSNIVIAIKRHNHGLVPSAEASNKYLWVKGKKSTRVRQLEKAYLEKYADPAMRVTLVLGDIALTRETRMESINHFPDGIIVLKAEVDQATTTSASAPSTTGSLAVPSENPLYPVRNAALTSVPAAPRPPLQPITRQLVASPTETVPRTEVQKPLAANPFSSRSTTDEPKSTSVNQVGWVRTPEPATTVNLKHAFNSTPKREPKQELNGQPQNSPYATREDYRPQVDSDIFVDPVDETTQTSRGEPLRQLAQDELPERLEAAVQVGVDVLSELEKPLKTLADHPDAQSWLQQIGRARNDAVRSRTVVGVVGNTGAGKSSVINAMLDEERLVPTNCMRACTAVVTELSYNYSDVESSRYRAEIEFIRPEDWRKELEVLFKEMFDDGGHISRETQNADSQAGVAYAKIRAVYHKLTKEQLSATTVEKLMRDVTVKKVLGTTKRISERNAAQFYKRLQQYVDSKEKGTETLDKNGNKITKPKRAFEHWPLIKVVKVYTKADALSKGSVIVDLPGVHDSNAARAAVAEGYMKQCTGLWIVAPITRAVDDKAAKNLLGDTFKRQLKYDGIYSAVTFICSKTDDISRTEAADSLKLGAKMNEIEDKMTDLESRRRALRDQLKSAKGEKSDCADSIEEIEEQLEQFEELQEKADNGETVFAPSTGGNKRKRNDSPARGGNKRRRASSASGDYSSLFVNEDEDNTGPEHAAPLTLDQIEEKITELRNLKKEARRERTKIDECVRQLTDDIEKLDEEESALDAEHSELCIAGRNEYSRSAIREDFAAGIRELDQENAEEEDPDNFNPDEDIRDYDEVARSLPVFCVSSRAYQKLAGRLQKDNDVHGFTTAEQTEIPQLQAHCKKLTERGRQASCRRFLNGLSQLLNSLGLWTSDDGSGVKLSSGQRNAEKTFLAHRLRELERSLEKCVERTLDDCLAILDDQLFSNFASAAAAAADSALQTSDGWGAHKNDGGLLWATYKATVRRDGVFTGASGIRDFNAALAEPMYKHLGGVWEKVFQRRLPHILQSSIKSVTDILRKFHSSVETRCREKGHGIARIGLLGNQLTAYQSVFGDLSSQMVTKVNEAQRDINREFTPVITNAMHQAYTQCVEESGPGSFKRMKGHMHEHVADAKNVMFTSACDQVRQKLKDVCGDVRKAMLDRADSVFTSMQRDYMSIIGGVSIDNSVSMTREERSIRRQLDDMISDFDANFDEVINADLESLVRMVVVRDDEDEMEEDVQDDGDDDFDNESSDGSGGEEEMERESSNSDDDEYHSMEDIDDSGFAEDTLAWDDED